MNYKITTGRFILLLACILLGTNSHAFQIESDSVVLFDTASTAQFVTVNFRQTYNSVPLVFALPTDEGTDSSALRIRNITTTGFQITQVEPQGNDGPHGSMTIDYIAIEPGVHTLPDGTVIQAGSIATTAVQHGTGVAGAESWVTVNFAAAFGGTPAVIAHIQGMANESSNPPGTTSIPWLTTTVRNVNSTSMQMALDRAEVNDGGILGVNETIGYMAIRGGTSGSFIDNSSTTINYEAIVSADNILGWNNGCYAVNFAGTYSSAPLVVASKNRHDGGDGGWVRRCNLSTTSVSLTVDEDIFRDAERNHTDENAGVIVFSQAFDLDTAAPLAVWHMDESSWPGAGSVIDSSGKSNNANPVGTVTTTSNPAAISGNPGTCGHGDIPLNNSAAIIDAVNTTLDVDTEIGNTGSITFWYRSRNAWNGGGDRQLFDASTQVFGNANDKYFYMMLQNDSRLVFSLEDSNDGDFSVLANTNNVTPNRWVHIAATWDLNNNRLRIYIDGVLDQQANITSNGVMGDVGNLFLGDNSSAYIVGTANSAYGRIDEVRIYSYEVGLTQVQQDMAAIHPCSNTTDHFDINHDGTAINCQAEPITIEAHTAIHAIDTNYNGTLTLSTSTGRGDWTVITGLSPIVNGVADDGIATYNMVAGDLGVVVLGLKDTTIETLNINVSDGSITELTGAALASEDQSLDFAQSGFVFLADGVVSSIGTQIGGKLSNIAPGNQLLELQAIRTSDTTGACEAALLGVNQIDLAFECRDPTNCTANQVNIDGGTSINIASNNAGTVTLPLTGSFTPANLDFGNAADTTATFTLNYPDVGELVLHSRYNIPLDDGSGTPSGIYMSGSSNNFVVRPFGFNVVATGNPAATGPAGGGFIQAGADYTTAVTAVLYQAADDDGVPSGVASDGIPDNHNDTDPSNNVSLADNTAARNYGQEVTTENIVLSGLLNQPGVGNDPGMSGTTTISAFVNGVGSTVAVHYDEVGIIEMTANVADGNYLGIGVPATANLLGKSGYVGRFYPDHFTVVPQPVINRSDILAVDCDGGVKDPFTYMGENFQITYQLEARNTAGAVTQNYFGAFAKLDPTVVGAMGFGATDSVTNLTGRLGVTSAGAFAVGVANVQATLSLARATTPDGHFADFRVGINPVDADGISLLPLPTLDRNLSLDGGAKTHAEVGQTDIRYGRLNLQNNFDSELLDLTMPLSTEYYQSTDAVFVTNVNDNCTTRAIADVLLYNDQEPKAGRAVGNPLIIVNGASTTTLTGITSFSAGQATMIFSAPNVEGYVDVEVQTPSWLLSDLDGIDQNIQGPGAHCTPNLLGGDPAFIAGCLINEGNDVDDVPLSRGNFGIFKGSDNVIYLREVVP